MTATATYLDFLRAKVAAAPTSGFDVATDDINPTLKPHTRAIVRWAAAGGRRAIFASFGLHKTATQIELMRLVLRRYPDKSALIVCPLGVRQEFFREADLRFAGDFAVNIKFIRSPEEIEPGAIHLTNYETVRDGKLDPNEFVAASLDEASVLRSFGSKTYQTFLGLFSDVAYRFVATATPSPNRFKELIHYAGFLGVMDTGQALTRFFQRDSTKANNLTLYPHKEREFWLWVSSWAIFLQKPSDLGFSDAGYALPPLKVRWHEIEVEIGNAGFERDGQGRLMRDGARGLAEEAKERRDALGACVEKVQALIAEEPAAHRIIWHDLEAERHAIAKSEALKRSMGVTRQERCGEGWTVANNDCVAECSTLPADSIDLIVTSIPFANHYEYTPTFEDFGHTDNNSHFFGQMDYLTPELLRTLKPGRLACIHVKDRINFGAVTGFGCPTVSPFHAETLFHFLKHGFVFSGMITVVTDVVRENNQTYRLGYTEMRKDGSKMGVGSSEYILLMRKLPSDRGKAYADERVVKQEADYSLARWQVDAHAFWRSSGDRFLSPDELAALPSKVLSRTFTEQTLKAVYDYRAHVQAGEALAAKNALPKTFMALAPGSADDMVWHDINRMRTLNGNQYAAGRELHLCPLQIDIVDRLIERFSQKGEVIFDPFSGLGTVAVRALKLGRRGRGVELNANYFRDSVRHLEAAEREVSLPSLFDILDAEAALSSERAA